MKPYKKGLLFAGIYSILALVLLGGSLYQCNSQSILFECAPAVGILGFPVGIVLGILSLFVYMETQPPIFFQHSLYYVSFIVASVIYTILLYNLGNYIERRK